MSAVRAADFRVAVTNDSELVTQGRLLLFFSQQDEGEPRLYDYYPTASNSRIFATNVERWAVGEKRKFSDEFSGYPVAALEQLPAGTWRVQALLDHNVFSADLNSDGNLYSDVVILQVPEKGKLDLTLALKNQVQAEPLPESSELIKYVEFKSEVLSNFWQRDVSLKAAVLLPNSYQTRVNQFYPVIFQIGGFRQRYTRVQELFEDKDFKNYWYSPEAPQAIVVFLDGEAPFGDSYQLNSKNNGPYGDATWQELLPYLQQTFRIEQDGDGFFTTGCSTGGWVSLALQIYQPELFNGAWSFSADPVDFSAFQLVDIYKDANAFVSEHGPLRPSAREQDGEVVFTIKDEAAMESALAIDGNFVRSSGQWGAWMALFSPRGSDGLPMPLWDGEGVINRELANTWRQWDLRWYLETNWRNVGPALAGKLHLYMGEMDDYYLNNAMRRFEDMLTARTNPESDAKFHWQPRGGHCDSSAGEMLQTVLPQALERWQAAKQ
ncbi:alpha/beta hydrolase-fold protein [Halioxenophilus aromaticivorans]|uniref:Alpha/beta hydrolase-fold protein n=1 Tax=Halioxenophilus aromaticivorans TaxID=1306992 RepID=A0AAV3U388_9ALTE